VPDELTADAPPAAPDTPATATPADAPPAPPRRRRARWVSAALVAVAVVVLAVVLWPSNSDDAAGKGPLRLLEPAATSLPVHLGEKTAFGLTVVANDGDEDAVLESVAPVDPLPGTTLVGTYAAGPDRRYQAVPATRAWPSRMATDVHPLAGFRVPPVSTRAGRRGTEVILVFRADRPGRFGFAQVRLTYRAGGKRHRATLLSGYAYCPVKVIDTAPHCPTPEPSPAAVAAS
jgi:hypothetical protein